MRAHRRIDSDPRLRTPLCQPTVIERLAHAMQALKLKGHAWRMARRQLLDRSYGVGVMSGKLGIDHIRRLQQTRRTSQITHIGVHFARPYGVMGPTLDLSALDLRIPVRALDQANHEAPLRSPRKSHHVIDHRHGAFLVGLNHKAQSVPAR